MDFENAEKCSSHGPESQKHVAFEESTNLHANKYGILQTHQAKNHAKTHQVRNKKGQEQLVLNQPPSILKRHHNDQPSGNVSSEHSTANLHGKAKRIKGGKDKENQLQHHDQQAKGKGMLQQMKERLADDLGIQMQKSDGSEALGIGQSASKPSKRLQMLKPQSLCRKQIKLDINHGFPHAGKSPISNASLFTTKNNRNIQIQLENLHTATHKFDAERHDKFLRMPTAIENTLVDSALPLGSGIPKLNPIKLNENIQISTKKEKKIQFHNKLQSPLTAFNHREKQFKKDLTGTYGKNYKINESKDNFTERLEELKERKEEKEQMKDLNLSNSSAIPNSYLYQPDSESRNWMVKRGKDKQAYLKND